MYLCRKSRCVCGLRKKCIYLDESYTNQNHVNDFSYYIPDSCSIKKPSGKGLRVVMIAALSNDGWVGANTQNMSTELKKKNPDNSHSYKSIKYWISKKSNQDYHINFDREIFLQILYRDIAATT